MIGAGTQATWPAPKVSAAKRNGRRRVRAAFIVAAAATARTGGCPTGEWRQRVLGVLILGSGRKESSIEARTRDASEPFPEPTAVARFPHHPLVYLAIAFSAGIAADRALAIPAWASATAVGALVGVWWIVRRRGRERWAALVLLFATAALGACWHHDRWHLFSRSDVGLAAQESPSPVALEGRVIEGPRLYPAPHEDPLRQLPSAERTRMEVAVQSLRRGDQWLQAGGSLTVLIDGRLDGVQSGDRVRIFGQLASPLPAMNPGDFDAAALSRAKRVLAVVRAEHPRCVQVVETTTAWNVGARVDGLQQAGGRMLWKNLSHERSGLASAVLLGLREQLDPETTEAFMLTGTVHILAISGLNVAILAACLFMALRVGLVPRKAALAAVAGLTVLYALITDAEPPVVRATVLVLVLLVAMWSGHTVRPWNSLAGAAIIVLALNPSDLFHAGAQLSFLAVGVLCWCGPRLARTDLTPLARLIRQTRPWPVRVAQKGWEWLWKAAALSTAVWVVTLPLTVERFHLAAPSAIVLNLVLALPVAAALVSGYLVLALGFWLPPAARLAGWVCDVSLTIVEWAVELASRVPAGHMWVPGPGPWWTGAFYGLLGYTLLMRPPARRWAWRSLAVWSAAGVVLCFLSRGAGPLDVTVLSVGHGSAVLCEMPDGTVMLCDAGGSGPPERSARSVSACLWSLRRRHIDRLVISHADLDHLNAVPDLLDRFSVGTVVVPPGVLDQESAGIARVRAAIASAGVPIREVRAGDAWPAGPECTVRVLHPPADWTVQGDNPGCLVLLVEHGARRMLLPGDLEGPGLSALLLNDPLDCDAVAAPHHGSRGSNTAKFAAWCRPEVVVVSGGHDWNEHFLARVYDAKVYGTANEGAIRLRLAPEGVQVAPFRPVRKPTAGLDGS
jgi:competence protein ComEC